MPLPIRACQRCGYSDLRIPSVRDGVIVGLGQDMAKMACDRCGLVAVPLEFDDEKALLAFRSARSGTRGWTRVD